MMWLISTIAFLMLLTMLVIAHEFGHYAAALWVKVRVEEFGFGLPPRVKNLFNFRGTIFSLNWIPFGGFVRLQGENSLDPDERHKKGSFAAASIPARLMILLAGVAMNLIIAIILFTLGFWIWNWVPTYLRVEDLNAAEARNEVQVDWALGIMGVEEGSPAEVAGVVQGDILTEIDGQKVTTFEEVLSVQEHKASVTYTVISKSDVPATGMEEFSEERFFTINLRDGKAGVEISTFALDLTGADRSFADGVNLALRETWTVTIGTIQGVGRLVSSLALDQRVPEDIAGIVGIAQLTHNSIQQGLMKYLRLVALLSLSLAVLNVLPFPALDGGRVLFVLYEFVLRRPMNRKFEVITNGFGIAFIMMLMIVVTWNDILRILTSG